MLALPWALAACALVSAVAAITDLRTRTIPNWLTLPLAPVGIVVHSVGSGFEGAQLAVLGCLFCFAPSYFLFVRGALGGGDVKLFAGFGAVLGAREGLELQFAAFVLVAAYALWVTAWHGRLGALLRASCQASLYLIAPGRFARPEGEAHESVELPMGAAIFFAALAASVRAWS